MTQPVSDDCEDGRSDDIQGTPEKRSPPVYALQPRQCKTPRPPHTRKLIARHLAALQLSAEYSRNQTPAFRDSCQSLLPTQMLEVQLIRLDAQRRQNGRVQVAYRLR